MPRIRRPCPSGGTSYDARNSCQRLPMNYSILRETPAVESYRSLRTGSGRSAKTMQAAERGLPNSLFAVQVVDDSGPVGMGRVIGDGGCFYQVVDIAVLKEHQGRGIGK